MFGDVRGCLLAVLLGSYSLLTGCDTEPPPPATPYELAREMETFASWERVGGFGVAVFGPDHVEFANGYGFSDLANSSLYTADTVQNVASISKTVIAIALLRAQEMGALSIDDPINSHLDYEIVNPHSPNVPITIRHLANHTSGLKYSEAMTDQLAFQHADMALGEFLQRYLSADGDWYTPENFHKRRAGELGDYSNVGASLAAHIIENAVGVKFDEFTKREIFGPLGMKNTTWHQPETSAGSHHYTIKDKSNFEAVKIRADALYPSGSLFSSARDLTRLCQMMMRGGQLEGNRILTERSVNEILSFKQFESLDDDIYRQGIFWYETKDQLGVPQAMYGHSGGHDSAFAMMFIDPEVNSGIVMLGNTNFDENQNHISYFNIYKTLWRYSRALRERLSTS